MQSVEDLPTFHSSQSPNEMVKRHVPLTLLPPPPSSTPSSTPTTPPTPSPRSQPILLNSQSSSSSTDAAPPVPVPRTTVVSQQSPPSPTTPQPVLLPKPRVLPRQPVLGIQCFFYWLSNRTFYIIFDCYFLFFSS